MVIAGNTLATNLNLGTGGQQTVASTNGDAYIARFNSTLSALNRGILLTPFHNMALMSPATTEADVDHHTDVFAAAVAELLSP